MQEQTLDYTIIILSIILAILILPMITTLLKLELGDKRENWERELDEAYNHLKQAEQWVYHSNQTYLKGYSQDLMVMLRMIEEIKRREQESKDRLGNTPIFGHEINN